MSFGGNEYSWSFGLHSEVESLAHRGDIYLASADAGKELPEVAAQMLTSSGNI